jgi:hypothetical protein
VEQNISGRLFKTNLNDRIRASVPNAEGKIVFPEPEEYQVEDIVLPSDSKMPTYVPGLRLTEISHMWFDDMAQNRFRITSVIDEGLCTVSKLLGVKCIDMR